MNDSQDRLTEGNQLEYLVGDYVFKNKGEYNLPGVVIGVCQKTSGKKLYVVEHMMGFCHIYSSAQLRPLLKSDVADFNLKLASYSEDLLRRL